MTRKEEEKFNHARTRRGEEGMVTTVSSRSESWRSERLRTHTTPACLQHGRTVLSISLTW